MRLHELVMDRLDPVGVRDPGFRRLQLLEELYRNKVSRLEIPDAKQGFFNALLDEIMADDNYLAVPTGDIPQTRMFIDMAVSMKTGLESSSDDELDSAVNSDLDSDDFDPDLDDSESMRP